MKTYALTILCCLTLLAVFVDLYRPHASVRAESGKRVYVDPVEIRSAAPAAMTTRGGAIVGFSCKSSPGFAPSCFVLSE